MREQLIQYVELLFAGAADSDDIKQEILQNTLDRYDDLISQGKVPEAAYRLAISGIGDINEILGTQSRKPALTPTSGILQKVTNPDTDKKKLLRALSAGLYILSIAPLYIFNGNNVGTCGFILLVAAATVLWMLGYEKKEMPVKQQTANKVLSEKKNIPIWAIIVITAAVTGTIILAVFGSGTTVKRNAAAATLATEPVVYEGPRAETPANATATANVNIRSSPSPEASVVGMLSTGEYITVSRQETVSGKDWSYITSPTAGWVVSEYIQMELIVDYGYSAPQQTGTQAKVINSTEVYTAPDTGATSTYPLNPGEAVTVTRQENINNTPWAYITEPVSGWVQTIYLEFTDTVEATAAPTIEETMATSQTHGYGCLASDIKKLDIHWPYGSILIHVKDTDRITVEETYDSTDSDLLVNHIDEVLEIRFCDGEPEQWPNIHKELTITVPADWECEGLEILGDLANVEICNLSVNELDYEGKAGCLDISVCAIENADLETTSGSISLVGSVQQLELEGGTAGIFAKLYNIPDRIEANSTAGDVTLMLPETTGFSLQCSHEFETDFDFTKENDRYITGNASTRIKLNAPMGLSAILKVQ